MKEEIWNEEKSMADTLLYKYILLAPNESLDFIKKCAFITLDEIQGSIIKIKGYTLRTEQHNDPYYIQLEIVRKIIEDFSEEEMKEIKNRIANYSHDRKNKL